MHASKTIKKRTVLGFKSCVTRIWHTTLVLVYAPTTGKVVILGWYLIICQNDKEKWEAVWLKKERGKAHDFSSFVIMFFSGYSKRQTSLIMLKVHTKTRGKQNVLLFLQADLDIMPILCDFGKKAICTSIKLSLVHQLIGTKLHIISTLEWTVFLKSSWSQNQEVYF